MEEKLIELERKIAELEKKEPKIILAILPGQDEDEELEELRQENEEMKKLLIKFRDHYRRPPVGPAYVANPQPQMYAPQSSNRWIADVITTLLVAVFLYILITKLKDIKWQS